MLKSSIWKQISNTHKSSRSRRDSPSYSNNILFFLFLANVHFFTFRLKTIISNEMEQHVFRFTNKLSPKTSQDASRQYISLYPPAFLFSFYLSFSCSFQFLLEFIIFKLLMRIMNASWKFLFIPDSKHFSHFSSFSSFYFT